MVHRSPSMCSYDRLKNVWRNSKFSANLNLTLYLEKSKISLRKNTRCNVLEGHFQTYLCISWNSSCYANVKERGRTQQTNHKLQTANHGPKIRKPNGQIFTLFHMMGPPPLFTYSALCAPRVEHKWVKRQSALVILLSWCLWGASEGSGCMYVAQGDAEMHVLFVRNCGEAAEGSATKMFYDKKIWLDWFNLKST